MKKELNNLIYDLSNTVEFFNELGADFVKKDLSLNKEIDLDSLNETILKCRKCPLHLTRTQAVPGEGNPKAQLMFAGEAPGRDEDIQGRPFVGRAGQLLTKIIKAMNFERKEVYITNIVKCRPPNNRNPQQKEIEACHPYLLSQIRQIKPRVIVALGKVAAEFFVPGCSSISAVRGTFHDFHGIPVMPTFHPSYLIRDESNKERKKLVWFDMKKVMVLLGKR
ncbi:MAG: uracil-DNA glycosylase [Acidobacteriota bacterium]